MIVIYSLIALSVLTCLILLFVNPRIFTLLSIFVTLFQFDWFVRYYHAPPILNRATLVFVGLLGIRILIHFLLKRPAVNREHGLFVPLILLALFFLFLTLISNLYNEERLLLGFYSLRYYLVGFVLTFAIYLYLPSFTSIDKFKYYITLVALIQLPVSVIKYLAATTRGYTLDSVTGTFGGYGELVICQVISIAIVLSDRFILRKNTLPFINTYLLCILLITPLILSKSRSASFFVIIIIAFILIYSLFKRKNFVAAIKQVSSSALIGLIFCALFYLFFWKAGNYDIEQQFDPDFVYNYYMHPPTLDNELLRHGADPRMGRFRAIATAWEYINDGLIHRIIGYGAGTASEASFLRLDGNHYQAIGPLSGIARNQYSKVILEFGLVGIFGFIVFFTTIKRRLRFIPDNSPNAFTIFAILLFSILILSAYSRTLENYFACFLFAYFIASAHSELDTR